MEELRSYECRFCGKRFPCGRSLGGHVRSHFTPEMVSSSSSAFEASDSHSDNEAAKLPRRTSARYSNSSSLSASETEQDREEVAMCLIMLSRDVDCWNRPRLESSDNFSRSVESENCSSGVNLRKDKIAIRRKHSNSNGESDLDSQRRRSRFECLTCNKRFHSYQALGGHRASHKKTRGCFASNSVDHVKLSSNGADFDQDPKPEKRSRFSTKKSSHECPICFKVFASGQALGGHKRSHVINGSDQTRAAGVEKPVPENRDFLDLNLPAPDEQ